MWDMKLTFGKSRVRSHVRASKTGKEIAVSEYVTKRSPGRTEKGTIWTMEALKALPEDAQKRAKAPKCLWKGAQGRWKCACRYCHIWRAIKLLSMEEEPRFLSKSIHRLDSFLKKYWQKTSNIFKAESTPFAVLLADDLASARDNGPQDDLVQGHEQLPWAAEDHAAAPPVEEEAPAEIEQIMKARQVQKALQAEIEALDQQLAHPLDPGIRGELLARHLDRLVKADLLDERLEEGEQAARVARQVRTHSR